MYPENLDNDVNLQIKYSPPSAGCCVFKDSPKNFILGLFCVRVDDRVETCSVITLSKFDRRRKVAPRLWLEQQWSNAVFFPD